MAAERNLLFGLLALQNGLIRQAQLVAAFDAWTCDKSRTLADHLIALGHLSSSQSSVVEALTALHVEAHGGRLEKSLAAVTAGESTRECLANLGDADLGMTLGYTTAGEASTVDGDAERTARFALGTAASDYRRFRVLRPHAKGGLGAVFVALDEELNREVALKQILDRHADDPTSRARFVLEAEITGGLEHPGIVPVYGLGAYADGRPYYAMRFIRGDSLKEAINAFHSPTGPPPPAGGGSGSRQLGLRKLLRSFTDVCNAIEYAHSRGVLHRDIKPSNVIVGKHGETLVVDWGLAKAVGRVDAGATRDERALAPSSLTGLSETLPGSALGTPAYMSPEQAAGKLDQLGPRSDVYSLGATLYCLLTGRPPFLGDDAELLLRQVQMGRFPSARALDPSIDQALDAISLKATAKHPEDRYASCRELAGDIERWLADEPVLAHRESAPARLMRWCRRHRTLVAGVAATLVAAVVALAIGTVLIGRQRSEALRQRDRAEDNLAVGRQIVDEMYTQAAVRLTDRKGMDADQRDLLLKAARFYEQFALPQSADPAVRLEAGRAGLRTGEILAKLGQTGPAEAAYGRALRLLDAVAAAKPTDAESWRALAVGYVDLADLYRDLGRKADAKTALNRAAELYGRLAAIDSAAAAPKRGIALTKIGLGNIENDLGRPVESENAFRKALELLEDLAHNYPGVTQYQSDQATAWNCLADLQRRVGRSAEAMASWERALAANQMLVRSYPDIARYRAALARVAHNLGTVQSEVGRPAEAKVSYGNAAGLREALVRDHPDVPLYRDELAGTYNNLGNLLRDDGKPTEARHVFEQAVALKDRLVLDHPDIAEYRSSLGVSLTNLGFLLTQIGKPSDGLPPIQRAVAIQEGLVHDYPDVVDYRQGLASSAGGLGSLQSHAGRKAEALRSLRRALELWATVELVQPGDLYNLACVHSQCGALIGGGRRPLSPEERVERDSHWEQAMAALRRALAARAAVSAWLRQDPDLDPLRSREDFRLLMMDLAFPADPFSRQGSTP
jgi:eukaryotic-like serine/threonine-protein kinase